jgi:hypothetical protein
MRSRPRGALWRARDSCHVGRGTSRPRRCVPSPLWGEGAACASFRILAWQAPPLSRRVSAPEFFLRAIANGSHACKNVVTSNAKPVRSNERAGVGPVFRSFVDLRQIKTSRNKRRKRNAGKRWVATAASCDAARALLERARLTAFHHGSHLEEYFIPKVSFRPGFLGLGLNGRYPPSPVPVQGCTSHPGHNAGRLIPKPPESRLQIRPRAPPSLP